MEPSKMKTRNEEANNRSSIQGAVCVIDGDSGIRNSLYTLLGTLGIQAATFSSAEEFLDVVDKQRPTFLITELTLPGMTGFELKEALDSRGIQVPVIGLTSESYPQRQREASRLGFLELVEKPFVYWSVVEQVRETLEVPS
jgi:FixJ family two-component response regulator